MTLPQKQIVRITLLYAVVGVITSICRTELILRLIPEGIRWVARISAYTTIIATNGVLIITVLCVFYIIWHLLKLHKIELLEGDFAESVESMVIVLGISELIKLCFTVYFLSNSSFSFTEAIPFQEQLQRSIWMKFNRILDMIAIIGGSLAFVFTLRIHADRRKIQWANTLLIFIYIFCTFSTISFLPTWKYIFD